MHPEFRLVFATGNKTKVAQWMVSRMLRRYIRKNRARWTVDYYCASRYSNGPVPAESDGGGDAVCTYKACVRISRAEGEAGDGVEEQLLQVFTCGGGHTCGWMAPVGAETVSEAAGGRKEPSREPEIVTIDDDDD